MAQEKDFSSLLASYREELDKLVLILVNSRTRKTVREALFLMFEGEKQQGEKHGGEIVELFLKSHKLFNLATTEGRAWLKVQLKIS